MILFLNSGCLQCMAAVRLPAEMLHSHSERRNGCLEAEVAGGCQGVPLFSTLQGKQRSTLCVLDPAYRQRGILNTALNFVIYMVISFLQPCAASSTNCFATSSSNTRSERVIASYTCKQRRQPARRKLGRFCKRARNSSSARTCVAWA